MSLWDRFLDVGFRSQRINACGISGGTASSPSWRSFIPFCIKKNLPVPQTGGLLVPWPGTEPAPRTGSMAHPPDCKHCGRLLSDSGLCVNGVTFVSAFFCSALRESPITSCVTMACSFHCCLVFQFLNYAAVSVFILLLVGILGVSSLKWLGIALLLAFLLNFHGILHLGVEFLDHEGCIFSSRYGRLIFWSIYTEICSHYQHMRFSCSKISLTLGILCLLI